jgi:murein DD-endopeptidase MepM/ murein hydrolase activator NlpD
MRFVLDPNFTAADYFPLDLSVDNPIWDELDITDIADLEQYLVERRKETGKQVGYGGFLEKRGLYSKTVRFQDGDERDIHLGVDFWAPAGTSVHALLDGVVHSFANNADAGNYGPTIILEHNNGPEKFYSLYGHLSLESLEVLEEGVRFRESEKIGTLGTPEVNGGYSPHVHLQIMKRMGDYRGDYPGVASRNGLSELRGNLIDPMSYINLNE